MGEAEGWGREKEEWEEEGIVVGDEKTVYSVMRQEAALTSLDADHRHKS